jgi:hypothetical protein
VNKKKYLINIEDRTEEEEEEEEHRTFEPRH